MIFNFINEMGGTVQLAVDYRGEENAMINHELSQCQQPISFKKVEELEERYWNLFMNHPLKSSSFYSVDKGYLEAHCVISEVVKNLKTPMVIAVDPAEERKYKFTIESTPW